MSQNFSVTIEHFLLFWNRHNMSIIEGLVAIIILLSLYMGYRTFFAKGEAAESESSLDTAKLEQTLEKILQSQASAGGGNARPIVVNAASADATIPGTVYTVAEVDNIVANLAESDKLVAELKAQLEEAQLAVSAAGAGGGGAGVSGQEKEVFESKIRDLETRLGEYEIISEDIADLARFREENDKLRDENEKLKSEIGLLRSTGAGAAAPPAPAPAQPAAAPPPPQEPPPPAAAPEPPPPAAEPLDTSSLIDDDLMAEFAAAVENQKAATSADGDPAADPAASLMNDFEDPANKKD
jgi:hypothetical protein